MPAQRSIRSFVLRAGRVTAGQERAWRELWPKYGIEPALDPIDWHATFGRSAPRWMEIGFGTGEVLGALAAANPHIDYIGVEVHRPGVGRLLLQADRADLKNLRVLCQDAVDIMNARVADATLAGVLIFFPDPWHKKRHHKRRLIDAQFVSTLAQKLERGGLLRLATDWQDYADQMQSVCNAEPALRSLSPDGGFVPRPDFRPETRFERRGMRLGHAVWDLAYVRR
jgi:tRNA (guanine-N7-)-methyltransferase